MKFYKTKTCKFAGSNAHEVRHKAFGFYAKIKRGSRRRTYVRSAYFSKNKIFLDSFWGHLFRKENWRDRTRRMRYFGCAIELIRKSRPEPTSKENPNKPSEILHRFHGMTAENEPFCVQIKEDKKRDQKFLISVFPTKDSTK